VNGKTSLAITVPSKFLGTLFDLVGVCLDSALWEAWKGGGGVLMLERELGEVNATLRKESGEHDTLRTVVGLVLNDFEMTSESGTSSLAVQVVNVADQACGMAKRALHLGVQRSFAITHSHYDNIDL
jgi:hypothetical protein